MDDAPWAQRLDPPAIERADVASPVPLLRTPVPGAIGRSHTPSKGPALGLSIPTLAEQRPVNSVAVPPEMPYLPTHAPPRPQLPKLQLATPMGGSQITPLDGAAAPRRGGGLRVMVPGGPASSTTAAGSGGAGGGSSDDSAHSRANSFGASSTNPAGSISSTSSMPRLNFDEIMRGGREPASADYSSSSTYSVGGGPMDYQSGVQGLEVDLEKLKLDKGRSLDIDDLDDMGWKAAKRQGLIQELGSLGEGAGGAVSRCKLKGGRTVFALKTITTNPDPDVKRQIVREMSFNKSCKNDYICKYYGAYIDDTASAIGIIMEFCEGGSLDAVYKEVREYGGRTSEAIMGKVAEGVLRGLDYLLSMRILHRDIKPSNILLTRRGEVKLCDFGVSGNFGTQGVANTFIGTSYYMAPERIQGQSYTITADVWSLGLTLLEVAQNRFPFPADGTTINPQSAPIELLSLIVQGSPPQLQDEVIENRPPNPPTKIKWSDAFKDFISQCLHKNPDERNTPKNMLQHVWFEQLAHKAQKKIRAGKRPPEMEDFLSAVWGWSERTSAETTSDGRGRHEPAGPPGHADPARPSHGETILDD